MTTAITAVTVRTADPTDVRALAKTMTRAFYDDPVVGHWCLADESRRTRRLEAGFEFFLRRLYSLGDCWTTDRLSGGALWMRPGRWQLGRLREMVLAARMARVYGQSLPRILEVLDFLEARHPRERHWYLQFAGVEPSLQGRGIGSALLRPTLEHCDREGLPAYLEASSERGRALYERLGFELVEEVRPPGDCPPLWLMWREAGR